MKTPSRSILGINPNPIGGALALYHPESGALNLADIPTIGRRKARRIDHRALALLINEWSADIRCVYIAEPSRQSAAVSVTQGICAGNLLAVTAVTANVWRKAVNAPKGECRARAYQLFPAHAERWSDKTHTGCAEAALVAYYGRLALTVLCLSPRGQRLRLAAISQSAPQAL